MLVKALPFVVFVIGLVVLLSGQHRTRTLTRQITVLEKRVTGAEKTLLATSPDDDHGALASKTGREMSAPATAAGSLVRSLEDIDLAALAEAVENSGGGRVPDLKQLVRMQTALLDADPEEIIALAERVAELDASERAKTGIIQQLVQSLSGKAPREGLVLAMESPYLDLEKQTWTFSHGFAGWIEEDPPGALAWFDEHIAAGAFDTRTLDGKSKARTQFEASALSELIGSNPSAARARLEALPASHRADILRQGQFLTLTEGSEADFAHLVRQLVPADEQAAVFTAQAGGLARRDGYDGVTGFIHKIGATAEERQNIASHAANSTFQQMGWQGRTPAPGELDALRAFVAAQAPAAADTITGEAIAHLASKQENFETAIGLVRDLHAASPSDDLLVGFLEEKHLVRDPEAAIELAGRIENPERRQAIIEKYNPSSP
jgi:hypothetical protein